MKVLSIILLSILSLTVNGQTYYIVRHAEKAQPSAGVTMATTDNPPLSKAGKERAKALGKLLKSRHIGFIFSTNTNRTMSTAKPLSDATGIRIETYKGPDEAFIGKLRSLTRNTLVVGHSNTVDDIVNALCNVEKVHGDLPDTKYDNLFVVKKQGEKISFEALTYGKATN